MFCDKILRQNSTLLGGYRHCSHVFWVHNMTISFRRFFWAPTAYFCWEIKLIITDSILSRHQVWLYYQNMREWRSADSSPYRHQPAIGVCFVTNHAFTSLISHLYWNFALLKYLKSGYPMRGSDCGCAVWYALLFACHKIRFSRDRSNKFTTLIFTE